MPSCPAWILWLKLMGWGGPWVRPSWTEKDWVNAAVPAASTIRTREARTRARFMAGSAAETKQAPGWCQPGLSARERGPTPPAGRTPGHGGGGGGGAPPLGREAPRG